MTTKPRKPSEGEREAMRYFGCTLAVLRQNPRGRLYARRIDRLCARVRREERQRCLKILRCAAADARQCGESDDGWKIAEAQIECGWAGKERA